MTKTVSDLLQGLPYPVSGSPDVEVKDIVFDSRQVRAGSLFVAFKGSHVDGHQFIPAAILKGATSVLCANAPANTSATVIQVADPLGALAAISIRFWDNPSRELRMVGITGTNGKTTTSFIIESIFREAGIPTGVMGTINYRFGNEAVPAPNTTPFASDLQRFLSQIVRGGGQACVMEVSSHALALGRVEGVEFDVGVFTNLTQDHLDFHKTLDAYGEAKTRLFSTLDPDSRKTFPRVAVINMDDPWGGKMRSSSRVPVLGYRLHGPADVYAKHIQSDANGSRFEIHGPGVQFPVRLPLLGEYNVMNALASAAVGLSQKIAPDIIVKGLENIPAVPGRMEKVQAGQPFTVVVDYAHTDDALRQVLTALRRLKPRKLITIFGCGGDRDRTKRPFMGEAAAALSDDVIVTSDNPRSEDPARITLDVEVGVRRVRTDHYRIIVDRKQAIAEGFQMAQEGDIVLIAGKGHENYQILADRTIPFDDRQVARELLVASTKSGEI